MRPNVPLLRKLVEWVEEQENLVNSQWDQKFWSTRDYDCNTTYCAAGYIAQIHGWEMIYNQQLGQRIGAAKAIKNGEIRWIHDIAKEELGLTNDRAGLLFLGTTGMMATASEIRSLCEKFAGEKL